MYFCRRLVNVIFFTLLLPVTMAKSAADASRDGMMNEIAMGIDGNGAVDNSGKSILARGCDPVMAQRASQMVPPQLGNPNFVACTNDDDFLEKLSAQKWNVVFFAPGACRYNAAKRPIPGGRAATKGWGLDQYRQLVRERQGKGVKIVETADERQIIPFLRKALEECV